MVGDRRFWSHKLGLTVTLLTDDEHTRLWKLVRRAHVRRNRRLTVRHLAGRFWLTMAHRYYRRIGGTISIDPHPSYYWTRASLYGRPCEACGRPYRTPQASYCAECGHEVPGGGVAGPLIVPSARG